MSDKKMEVLKKYTQAWNDHDIDTIMSLTAEDCAFYTIAGETENGTVHVGRENVKAAFVAAWTNIPDAAWLEPEIFILDENRAMSTCLFKGTDLEGGKHEARMVDLYTFSGNKVAIKSAFRKNRPAVK